MGKGMDGTMRERGRYRRTLDWRSVCFFTRAVLSRYAIAGSTYSQKRALFAVVHVQVRDVVVGPRCGGRGSRTPQPVGKEIDKSLDCLAVRDPQMLVALLHEPLHREVRKKI